MMTHAYSQLYLGKCSRAVGFMLHHAVVTYGMDGADFLDRFIQSGVAKCIEDGSPKYIAGKSGMELYSEVMELATGRSIEPVHAPCYDRSPQFWAGWVLAHYQWYSGRTFSSILDVIPYTELIKLYDTLHEADIRKSYEVFDLHFSGAEVRLKTIRKKCGLTQEKLSAESGVSLNTIRAYERKSKDLTKAQFDIIMRLANALKCEPAELCM